MILDRKLQLEILTKASRVYPHYIDATKELGLDNNSTADFVKKLAANIKYLEQHELIQPHALEMAINGTFIFQAILITHKGLDFLADDGGLSAILGVVTIKFETDTLKAILENRINQSDLSQEQKRAMNLALDELPAEGIKHLTTKLLDEGLENLPSALILISTYLGLS
ncbi:hypothetical protein [Acinetobacter vivianii]|uniref:hypothetical protein n=1 Tax=Acinetobacter vivianii TaxID=1776742 RepID=UPI0040420063